ncbi:MAG: phosphatase PAP2 family protein [Tannerellaceae bacterium]
MKNYLLTILFILYASLLQAQQQDSIRPELHNISHFEATTNKITSSKAYRMLRIPVPLFITSAITYSRGNQFRAMRNTYAPTFSHHYDDYLQYIPAVAMVGMKLGGVKGRSSWGRMLVSDAFSVALMAGTVNILKSSINRTRPDGSQNNSFPSGHTATAFMTATMMHHEYGLTRSPLYSIGAYTLATATAFSRQLNNRHWLSDVLAGAGIGIASTELGYFLADLIFKDKGLNMKNNLFEKAPVGGHPSFLEFGVGYSIMNGSVEIGNRIRMSSPGATHLSAKGAYFFSPYFGIGGEVAALASQQSFDGTLYEANSSNDPYHIKQVNSEQMGVITAGIGPYFSFPLTPNILFGTKFLAGYAHYSANNVTADLTSTAPNTAPITGIELLKGEAEDNLFMRTGLSVTGVANRSLAIRLYIDYDYSFLNARYSVLETSKLPEVNYSNKQYSKNYIHYFTIGAAVTALFW